MSTPNPTMDWLAGFLGHKAFYNAADLGAGDLACTIERVYGNWVVTDEATLFAEALPVPLLWFRNDEQGSPMANDEILVVGLDDEIPSEVSTRFRRLGSSLKKPGISMCTIPGTEFMRLLGDGLVEGLKFAAKWIDGDREVRSEHPDARHTFNRFARFAENPERRAAHLLMWCRPEKIEAPPLDDVNDQLRHTLRSLRNLVGGSGNNVFSFFCEDYVFRLVRKTNEWKITEYKPPVHPSRWMVPRGVWFNNSSTVEWDHASAIGIGLTPGRMNGSLLEQVKRMKPYVSRMAEPKDRALDFKPMIAVLDGFVDAVDDVISDGIKRETKEAYETVRALLHVLAKADRELSLWSRSTKKY